jgi:hypothetical protein
VVNGVSGTDEDDDSQQLPENLEPVIKIFAIIPDAESDNDQGAENISIDRAAEIRQQEKKRHESPEGDADAAAARSRTHVNPSFLRAIDETEAIGSRHQLGYAKQADEERADHAEIENHHRSPEAIALKAITGDASDALQIMSIGEALRHSEIRR